MGNPSALRYVPANSASTPIDWSKVPEASKKFLLNGWGHDWKTDKRKSLPATIGDLANMLNGSKFFGEFGLKASAAGNADAKSVGPRFCMKCYDEVWFVLLISGKREGVIGYSSKVEPKFDFANKKGDEKVMEGDQNDGKERQNDGEESEAHEDENEDHDEDQDEDDGEDEKEHEDVKYDDDDDDDDYTHTKAEEIAMAQAFDATLDQEARRPGIIIALDYINKLNGWSANTIKSSLEQAQFADAMMTLPLGHPFQSTYLKSVFSTLRR